MLNTRFYTLGTNSVTCEDDFLKAGLLVGPV